MLSYFSSQRLGVVGCHHRATGPVEQRFAATTWGRHMSVLSVFYRWAIAVNYATAQPFTYRTARALFADTGREVKVNLAIRRTPKPHVTIKYLEPDFAKLFMQGLRGLAPDGTQDTRFHGRELARNAAVGGLALATGLRLQEFTYLPVYEIPAPSRPLIPEPYDGRQFVGIDLHRQRSVIVRPSESGEQLSAVRIVNDPVALQLQLEQAGADPEVVLEATYGWYWAVDVLQAGGARVHLAHPLGVRGFRYRRVK